MQQRERASRAATLTAGDWVAMACRAIAEAGIGAVAVEALAQRLGVTKGSFYWHFPNREALLRAALTRWEEEATEQVIVALTKIADAPTRLTHLIATAFDDHPNRDGMADEVHTLAFNLAVMDAANDPVVRPVLRRVSERRIAYLEESFRTLGLSPEKARHRGLLAYSAYVGTLRLAREAPDRMPRGDDLRAYHRHLIETLIQTEAAVDAG